LAPGGSFELRCSAHAVTTWCSSLERRATQHCNSRSWTGSDYTPASVPVSRWPVHGNCTIVPPPRPAGEMSDADQALDFILLDFNSHLAFCGTEWPIVCWCGGKKLLIHTMVNLDAVKVDILITQLIADCCHACRESSANRIVSHHY